MSVTYSTFVLKFPEFTTADVDEQSRITGFITDATLEVNSTAWGTKVDLGVSYLAAHRLAMANRTLIAAGAPMGSGSIAEAKVAKLALKFTAPLSGGGSAFPLMGLDSTPYGLVYAELRSTLSITPITA